MQTSEPQRRIHLQHAEIHTDATRLRRTARFTDGSTRAVIMNWTDVTRVAAFRREVMAHPILCLAISDPANIVVLDERMDGWHTLVAALTSSLAPSTSFAAWSANIPPQSPDSAWTVLFRPPTA